MELEKKPTVCDSCEGKQFFYMELDGFLRVDTCKKCLQRSYASRASFCMQINAVGLDATKKHNLASYKAPLPAITAYSEFYKKQKRIKISELISRMLENPGEYQIVKALEIGQIPGMHIVSRNPIFVPDLKNDRKKYTQICPVSGAEVDIPKVRTFKGWGDTVIRIQGPIIDENDKKFYYGILDLHNQKRSKGLTVKSNFSELWRTIGNKGGPNAKSIASIKRSLDRISYTVISVKNKDNTAHWSGPLFASLKYIDKSTRSEIWVSLNPDCIPIYQNGEYTPIKRDLLYSLNSYARRIFEFLSTQNNHLFCMGLEKWANVLAFKRHISDDPENEKSNSYINRMLNSAIKELIDAGICHQESKIENGIVYTHLLPDHQRSTGQNLI